MQKSSFVIKKFNNRLEDFSSILWGIAVGGSISVNSSILFVTRTSDVRAMQLVCDWPSG